MQRADVIVLGAGIVGVSAAWHLLRRGRSVILVDRAGPAAETSYGNSGIVEREAFVPVAFPRSLAKLLRYAMNRAPEVRYEPAMLPRLARWLWALRRETGPVGIARHAAAMNELHRLAVVEHRKLAAEAEAERFFRQEGWIRLYRSEAGWEGAKALHDFARHFGARFDVLEPEQLAALEPDLKEPVHRAVLWPESDTVSSPGGVTRAYADAFIREGGRFLKGDARTLDPAGGGYELETEAGRIRADQAVVALGAWSTDILAPLGYRFPLAVKRGYHRHYAPLGSARLNRPVVDVENGFVITPMEAGIRLTTGIEFAHRDAPPKPVQIERVLPIARRLFPLGEPVDDLWLGRRPAFPDSRPVIGEAPRHRGLWLDFGHGHVGFTLGPVSGRLLAELMTGANELCADPEPFRADRF